jgi:hypothetical protein
MKKNKLFLINLLLPFAMFSQSLTSISPSSLIAADQTLDVMITGDNTHFAPNNGTVVTFQLYKTDGTVTNALNSFTVLSATSLRVNITVPASTETGDYWIYVYDLQDGGMNSLKFHLNGTPPPASIDIYNPMEILAQRTLDITIHGFRRPYGYGTHFNDPNGSNATKVLFKSLDPNDEIVINSMTITNDSTIIVNITTPAKGSGHDVYVSDNIDGLMHTQVKVYPACPLNFTTSYNPATNAFTLELDSLTSLSTSFRWNFGDGTASTDAFPTHLFAKDSLYVVCLQSDSCWYCRQIGIDSNGNPVLRTKGFTVNVVPFKGTTTGIISNENTHPMSIYPNPADNLITITTSLVTTTSKSVLSIYSIEGKLILQQVLVKEKMDLDVSAFKKGIYIMQVTGSDKTERVKFIKD